MSGDIVNGEAEVTDPSPDENAQRKVMSDEERAKLIASRWMYRLTDFDYSGARDAVLQGPVRQARFQFSGWVLRHFCSL